MPEVTEGRGTFDATTLQREGLTRVLSAGPRLDWWDQRTGAPED